MINIFTVIAIMFLAAVFYILEFCHAKERNTWLNAKGNLSKEYRFHDISSKRCLWLGRLFLISGVILAVIEQITFI